MDIVWALEKQIGRFAEIVETSVLKSNLQPENMEAKHRFFWSQCKYLKTLMVWRRHLPKDQLDRLGNLVINRIIAPVLKPETYPTDLHLQNEALLQLSLLQK
jgi:GC-rich sequence DNA-binding factor